MLTEAQVAKARTFPGCGDITAENAVDKLFAAAEVLQSQAKPDGKAGDQALRITALEAELAKAKAEAPFKYPPEVLKAMAKASRTYMTQAVKSQAVSPVVAELLASVLIGSDDAPSAVGLTPGASGECLASAVFNVLCGNTPMPLVGREPQGQPAPRAVPGQPNEGKEPTAERLQSLMSMTHLGQAALNNGNGNGKH